MLQDAIWADTERLESDPEYSETSVALLRAVIRGWIYSTENPDEAAEMVLEAGSEWEIGRASCRDRVWMAVGAGGEKRKRLGVAGEGGVGGRRGGAAIRA